MHEGTPRSPVLILGIGNYLMGDEGLGVHMAHRLEARSLPAGVHVVEGGTGGFHLMPFFEDHEKVILIDATLDDRPPGTIRLLRPRFSSDFPKAMSTHDIGLKDVIEALILLDKMPEVHLFAVSIATLQNQSIKLSEPVIKALDDLEKQIFSLLAFWGFS